MSQDWILGDEVHELADWSPFEETTESSLDIPALSESTDKTPEESDPTSL